MVKFKMNQFQEFIFDNFWYFTVILKARQLGITTFFSILYLDAVLFNKNKTAGILAHTEKDASKIFTNKVKFAFNNLPKVILNEFKTNTDSASELSFPNGSNFFVTVSTRSGTVQYLHISELGYTDKKYPDKSNEIVAGSINSVEKGQFVSIESTAEANEGNFYRFCQDAQRLQKQGIIPNELEFKFFFFPWWQNKEYSLDNKRPLTSEMKDYFDTLKKMEGIELTDGQKQWYASKRVQQEENMYSQYPSTPEEAFRASIEGAYYAKQMGKLYEEKRVAFVPYDPKLPVDTWWDLGMNDFNVILFTQRFHKEIRFIDCYYNQGEGLQHYVKVLQERKYVYGRHYLPHDIMVRDMSTGIPRFDTLKNLGLKGLAVVPKLSIEDGIEMVRNLFGQFWIDKEHCSKLVEAINNYRKDWNDKVGQFANRPLHNEASHFCDALRLIGVIYKTSNTAIQFEENKEFDKYGLFNNI